MEAMKWGTGDKKARKHSEKRREKHRADTETSHSPSDGKQFGSSNGNRWQQGVL